MPRKISRALRRIAGKAVDVEVPLQQGHFHTGQDQPRVRAIEVVEGADVVMIGDRQEIQALRFRQVAQLARSQAAVGAGAVRVQIPPVPARVGIVDPRQ